MQDDPDAAFIAGAESTPTPAPEPAAPEPEAKESEAKAEPEAPPEPEAKPGADDKEEDKEKRTPWFQRRIDDLLKDRWQARQEAEALRAQIAQLATQVPTEGEKPAGEAPKAIAADPVEIARQMVETQRFNDACNATYEQGAKEFPDFDASLKTFGLLGGMPPTLVEAAIEAGDAHKILYTLGKDPDEAARILALPPVRMAAAVAKLAAKPAPVKAVSKAPDPPTPIGGRGTVDEDPEKMTMDQWMKWHDAQQAKKRA